MPYGNRWEVGDGETIDAVIAGCCDPLSVEAVPIVVLAVRENAISLGDGFVIGQGDSQELSSVQCDGRTVLEIFNVIRYFRRDPLVP